MSGCSCTARTSIAHAVLASCKHQGCKSMLRTYQVLQVRNQPEMDEYLVHGELECAISAQGRHVVSGRLKTSQRQLVQACHAWHHSHCHSHDQDILRLQQQSLLVELLSGVYVASCGLHEHNSAQQLKHDTHSHV
jgi:hypothetical protein